MVFEKIAIIGIGLLGGSLGLAVKRKRLASKVDGYVRRSASIQECLDRGVADHVSRDLGRVVDGADLVVLCTPLSQMAGLVEQMKPSLKKGALVTDVGSVKGSVVRELTPMVAEAGAVFLGAHPMAGAEKMGVAAAREGLFDNSWCVLTPLPETPVEAFEKLKNFWVGAGARVLKLTVDLHDELVCRSSHLPHVVAAELANYVLSPMHPREQALLCATGFRDVTRIASGSPEMWRDIALGNRAHLSRILGVFIEDLQELRLALDSGNQEMIDEFFEKAKQRRDQWMEQSGSPE